MRYIPTFHYYVSILNHRTHHAYIFVLLGGSDDWAQGGAGIRYSFTMELPPTWGVGSPGFELPPDQILPVGRETYAGVAAMLRKLIEVSGNENTVATLKILVKFCYN